MPLKKLLRLVHGLVGVVIHRTILHELTDGALALIDAGEDGVEAGDGVIQFFGEFGIFRQLADRALTGVYVGQ